MTLPNCSKCACEYVYEEGNLLVCPECSHEWSKFENAAEGEMENYDLEVKDASGNVLKDGDTIVVLKDLKIKGSSSSVKVGTKVKNIRLVAGDHDIDCKIPGIGSMGLKSEFVRKVTE
jgi:protein PhnA